MRNSLTDHTFNSISAKFLQFSSNMCCSRWNEFKFNQAMVAVIATFGGFGLGNGLAWSATALPSYSESGILGPLTPEQKSWMASLFTVGAMLACPIAGLMVNFVGRRKLLMYFAFLIAFPGWALLSTASQPGTVNFCRLVIGLGSCGYSIVVPVYIREIASPDNRGKLGSFFLFMINFGKVFSYSVGSVVDAGTAALICALHPIIFGLLLLLIPESPVYLRKNGFAEKAEKNWNWLQVKGTLTSCRRKETTTRELPSQAANCIPEEEKDNEDESPWSSYLTSSEFWKPTLSVLILMLLTQFCGVNVMTFFTLEIFESTGNELIPPKLATVLVSGVQTLASIPVSLLVDRSGRRGLLISSFVTMAFTLTTCAFYFYVNEAEEHRWLLAEYPSLRLIPLVAIVLYFLAFSWGIGSVVWIVLSEILPPRVVGPCSAMANVVKWGSAFAVTQSFRLLLGTVPLHYFFATFAGFCAFGCIFVITCLPETKCLTLQQIQQFYSKKKTNEDIPGDYIAP